MVRFKNRWLLIEFVPVDKFTATGTKSPSGQGGESELSSRSIFNALRASVQHNFGATGWGAVGGSLNVKYFSPVTNMCIVRVARDHHRIAWGAITLLTDLGVEARGRRYIPQVIQISGTIKKVQIAAIRHDAAVIARTKSARSDSLMNYLQTSKREIEAMGD